MPDRTRKYGSKAGLSVPTVIVPGVSVASLPLAQAAAVDDEAGASSQNYYCFRTRR